MAATRIPRRTVTGTAKPVVPLEGLPRPLAKAKADQDFDLATLYPIGQGDPREAYHRRETATKTTIAWGQLKLLITELDFLTRYWNPETVPTPWVLYLGAAEGHHIAILSKLFPQARFVLYDQRAFSPLLAGLPNVETRQRLFLEADYPEFTDRKDVFLISDIRSLEYSRIVQEGDIEKQRTNEEMVRHDMNLQAQWVKVLRPVKAHLKFRLPYSWEFVRKEIGPGRMYLDGTVYRQAWAPQTSTECRLVPNDPVNGVYIERYWDYQAHEEMLFYHNTRVREGGTFVNPLGDLEGKGLRLGLTADYDSTLTLLIIRGYLEKFGLQPTADQVYSLAAELLSKAHPGKTLLARRSGLKVPEEDAEDE